MASRRRIWWWVLGSIAVLALAAAVLAGYALHVVRSVVRPPDERAQLAAYLRHRDEFLEDLRLARTLPQRAAQIGGRDAGAVLGPRAGWLPGPSLDRYLASLPEADRRVSLPAGLVDQLGKEWLDADPVLWAGLDVGWMSGLGAYAYWDLDANAPGEQEGRLPVPSWDLRTWARVRLLKGLRDGEAARAVGEVEELARLCTTAEDVSVTVLGLVILEDVADARGRARSSARGGTAAGSGIDHDALRRMRRAFIASLGVAQLRAPAAVDADWVRMGSARCEALRGGVELAIHVRPALERAQRPAYDRLSGKLASAPECRLRRLRERWAQPDGPAERSRFCGNGTLDRLLCLVPASRILMGEIALTIAEPDPWRAYGRADAPTP